MINLLDFTNRSDSVLTFDKNICEKQNTISAEDIVEHEAYVKLKSIYDRLNGGINDFEKECLLKNCFSIIGEISDNFYSMTPSILNLCKKTSAVFGRKFIFDYLSKKSNRDSNSNFDIDYVIQFLPFLMVKPLKRKIRNIAIYYPRICSIGGVETFIEHVCKLFISMGYNVILITSTPKDQMKIDVSNVKVENIEFCWNNITMKYINRMYGILTKNSIDLFYTQNYWYEFEIINAIIANYAGCYTMVHYHNTPFIGNYENWKYRTKQFTYLKYYDHCITLASDFEKYFNDIGIDNTYIPNIISDELMNRCNGKTQAEKTIDVLWFGRLDVSQKGLDRMPEIFKHLNKLNAGERKLNIRVMGEWFDKNKDGKNTERKIEFYKTMDELNQLSNISVQVKPEYGSKNVYDVIEKSKVVICTSEYEGFCYSIMESIGNGVPVVSTKLGGLTTLEDKDCVVQCSTNEKIAKCAYAILNMNDDNYIQLSNKCKSFVKSIYANDAVKSKYKDILENRIFKSEYAKQPTTLAYSILDVLEKNINCHSLW